jgi:hypothetical protein
MKQLLTFLFLAISAIVFSQAPQSIPYQAVVRNTDGTAMANAAVTITFKIHDNSATGTVVYEETHTTTTNAQGLVSLNVGGGTAVTGTFAGIQWGVGSKFLQALMNTGNGIVDLGTQQMMSVPYALYAEDLNVRVSATGDSLFIGDQVSIVPGVSAANYPQIGEYFEGGIVFYIDETAKHGLVYDTLELSTAPWGCIGNSNIVSNTTLGSGLENSLSIVQNCMFPDIAAALCLNSNNAGFSDWYLPSIDELNIISLNVVNNNFKTDGYYWSSSGLGGMNAYRYYFPSSSIGINNKNVFNYVRAIRSF